MLTTFNLKIVLLTIYFTYQTTDIMDLKWPKTMRQKMFSFGSTLNLVDKKDTHRLLDGFRLERKRTNRLLKILVNKKSTYTIAYNLWRVSY